MNQPLRILVLAIFALGIAACGRPERGSPDNNPSPSKQNEISDFSFQDFVPLVQINDSFVQETNGIMKTKFHMSFRPNANISFMRVVVNGAVLTSGYSVSSGNLVFDVAPIASAQIAVSYDPENLREAIAIRLIVMPETLDLESIRARFNNQDLYLDDLRMARNTNGEIVLDPSAIVFDYQDSYQLIQNRGLHLEVSALKID